MTSIVLKNIVRVNRDRNKGLQVNAATARDEMKSSGFSNHDTILEYW